MISRFFGLAGFGTLALAISWMATRSPGYWAFDAPAIDSSAAPVRMRAEDGKVYRVGAAQSLGEAMATGQQEGQEGQDPGQQEGHCYNDGLDPKKIPPEGKAPCDCYKTTECKAEAGENRTCKRYCKKDKCDCCAY